MLRVRLLTLACAAVLGFGLTSKALADPITVHYTATQIASDPVTGDQMFDLDFSVDFNADCEITKDCNLFDDGLWAVDVFFDLVNVIEVVFASDLFDTSSTPDPNLFDGWFTDNFGDSVGYFGVGFEVLPGATFGFLTTVNVGDAIVDSSFSFLDTTADPFLFSWGDNFTDADVIVNRVPEPGTLALFGLGLFALGAARRRRKI